MAAIIDLETTAHDAVWALLEGRSSWAALVKDGNRRKIPRATVGGQVRKNATLTNDFPQAALLIVGGADSAANTMKTFGTFAGCTAQPREIAIRFLLGLTHRGIDLVENGKLVQETYAAFTGAIGSLNTAIAAVSAGTRVKQFGPIGRTSDRTGERQAPFASTGATPDGIKRAWDSLSFDLILVSRQMAGTYLT